MPPKERRLWKIVFNNFLNSLKSKPIERPIGVDEQGNKYFEIPADPRGGRRLPKRWFVPINEEIGVPTPEWSQWLRGRRIQPPTIEEIEHNKLICEMKKVNAKNIANKFNLANSTENNSTNNSKGFPDLSDKFERQPGHDSQKRN
ncbi:NADH dehydrogenase [ubiquinone] 1 alpha subcomplex assembly factor 2 [Daktulosphaira vitifoliae]|uniref:NADH dehydrogenase [ubiquinone] 1 alpha subcomplex assembly factor 2 n=1 Tax=Daktulosphaira vitifoliae TaxID=58002 RepID=UPI0021AA4846|nr:NADH dehydrogenase [ubiquinone] 1 alpha subcomplex assembly factor 2 [Daktulosphaira vitifoliae]